MHNELEISIEENYLTTITGSLGFSLKYCEKQQKSLSKIIGFEPGNSRIHDRSGYVEIKCQLDATEVFIADLIPCSTCFGHHYAHHQELKSIIQWLLPVVFRAVVFKLLVWCGAEGYVSGLQDAAEHVEQEIRYAIKTSVASSWHFIST